MSAMLRVIGNISIILLLTSTTMMSASGGLSVGAQKREKIKTSGWIGVMIQDVNEKIARKAKLDFEEGAYVIEVVEDSPADSAGIQEGDVVIEFNGKKVFDSEDMVKIVHRTLPETHVGLVLIREGEKKTLQLKVGKKKESKHCRVSRMPNIPDVRVFMGNRILGLQLLTLNEQLGEYFGTPNNEGVLVEEVEHKSTAEKAGFKAGDIIIRVGKKTIDAVEKIQKELQKYDEGEMVEFEVMRKSTRKILKVEMEEDQYFRKEFFFKKPHHRMFQSDPLDDAEMRFEMDRFLPEIDHVQRELEGITKNSKKWEHEIHKPLQRFTPQLPNQVKL